VQYQQSPPVVVVVVVENYCHLWEAIFLESWSIDANENHHHSSNQQTCLACINMSLEFDITR
jgi:hypothetical protein